ERSVTRNRRPSTAHRTTFTASGITPFDQDRNLSSYSFAAPNRNDSLDILAPGESIIGAYANTTSDTGNLENLYAIGAGTSFATPQVAGSILLLNELYFDLHGQYPTVDQILAFLTQSGQPFITDANPPDGGGGAYPLLNIYHALQAVPEPISLVLLTPALLVLLTVRPRRALPPLAA
ncbi:MAG: S8 family serine peptidase, partial [Phycisphaeraceae bacterium]